MKKERNVESKSKAPFTGVKASVMARCRAKVIDVYARLVQNQGQ